jgi:ketopantoate hydroxymethyltransferase
MLHFTASNPPKTDFSANLIIVSITTFEYTSARTNEATRTTLLYVSNQTENWTADSTSTLADMQFMRRILQHVPKGIQQAVTSSHMHYTTAAQLRSPINIMAVQ